MRTNGMAEAGALGIEGGPNLDRMKIAEEFLNRTHHFRSGSPEAIAADEEINRIFGIDVSGKDEVAGAKHTTHTTNRTGTTDDAVGTTAAIPAGLSQQNDATEHTPLTPVGAAPSQRVIRSIDDIGRTEEDDLIDSGLSEKDFWARVKERKEARAAATERATATADPGQDQSPQPTATTVGQGGEGRSQNSSAPQSNATSQLKYPSTKAAWTAKDLETGHVEEHTWHGFLAPGAITLMHSLPKRGKTFLAFGLIRELLRGQPFLNRPTKKSGVVYLSEEGRETLRTKFERFGITDADPFWVYSRRDPRFAKDSLKESISRACALAAEHKAELVVMDTLIAWAGEMGNRENFSAGMERVFKQLKDLAEVHRLAIWVMHHSEKQGLSVRGSNAMEGAADVIVRLSSPHMRSKRRTLDVNSRLAEVPPRIHYRIVGDGFETRDVRREKTMNEIMVHVPDSEPGISISELEVKTGKPARRLHENLSRLKKLGRIEMIKSGDSHTSTIMVWTRSSVPNPL